jgi:integrase
LARVLDYWEQGTAAKIISGCTIGQAIERFMTSRRETNCRRRYVEKFGMFLNRFAKGREELPIGKLDFAMAQDFLTGGNKDGAFAPVTRNTYLKFLQVFLHWCADHELIVKNPIAKNLKASKVDFVTPAILTSDQVAKALRWAQQSAPELLAYISIAIFTGVRPEELDRMTWDMVGLENGLLRLPPEILKDRRPRQCHLQPIALEWITLAKSIGSTLPLNGRRRMRKMGELRELLGFKKWPHDIFRHTAGSHLTALLKSADAVSLELGNSPEILLRHYRALVRPEEDAEFWHLTPEKVRGDVASTASTNPTAGQATAAADLVPA